MSKILVAATAVGMLAALSLAPQQVQARNCSMLTTDTAHGATQGIATNRAERILQRYVKPCRCPPWTRLHQLFGLGGRRPPPSL
jgi:hypothetical protein